jgi:hypothetical protein
MLRALHKDAKNKLSWVGSDAHELIAFPTLRLLFSSVRPLDFGTNNLVGEVLTEGGVTVVGDWLELVLSPETTCGAAFPKLIPTSWTDYIRLLIALTIDMGPLGKMDKSLLQKHVQNFDTFVVAVCVATIPCSYSSPAPRSPPSLCFIVSLHFSIIQYY